MQLFLDEIKRIIETHPDYTEGDFEVRNNKGFETLYLCDIAVIRVIHQKSGDHLELVGKYLRLFGLDQECVDISTEAWIKVNYDDQAISTIYRNIKEVFKKCYKDSAELVFGCCDKFVECSDAKKCTYNNSNKIKRFPSGCMYKDNLDSGRIFYSRNKNYPPLKDLN